MTFLVSFAQSRVKNFEKQEQAENEVRLKELAKKLEISAKGKTEQIKKTADMLINQNKKKKEKQQEEYNRTQVKIQADWQTLAAKVQEKINKQRNIIKVKLFLVLYIK